VIAVDTVTDDSGTFILVSTTERENGAFATSTEASFGWVGRW
jgi:hypothetical protein